MPSSTQNGMPCSSSTRYGALSCRRRGSLRVNTSGGSRRWSSAEMTGHHSSRGAGSGSFVTSPRGLSLLVSSPNVIDSRGTRFSLTPAFVDTMSPSSGPRLHVAIMLIVVTVLGHINGVQSNLTCVEGGERMPHDGIPRIEPLPEDEWDDELRTLIDQSWSGPPPGNRNNLYRTLARHRLLFRTWSELGRVL